MNPKLVVLQGVPGAGKTTLMSRLAKDLSLPAVAKDEIKENLYEIFGTVDLAWKEMLGRASIRMLYELIDELLAAKQSFIVENAFFSQYAVPQLTELASKHNAEIIEIYCHVSIDVAKQRFVERQKSGQRHPGHRDDLHAKYIEDEKFWARYQPLNIGTSFTIQTEKSDEGAYQLLIAELRKVLDT